MMTTVQCVKITSTCAWYCGIGVGERLGGNLERTRVGVTLKERYKYHCQNDEIIFVDTVTDGVIQQLVKAPYSLLQQVHRFFLCKT